MYDLTLGDATARRIRQELARGSYENTRRLLATTGDPDLRSFYVGVAATWPDRPGWLDAWVDAEPRCAFGAGEKAYRRQQKRARRALRGGFLRG